MEKVIKRRSELIFLRVRVFFIDKILNKYISLKIMMKG